MRSKQDDGKAWHFFNVQDKQAQSRQDLLIKSLRHAVERDELHLVYQPQIDILSGEITGLETLLRWNNPEFGSVPPMEFIPLAESSGLMVSIGTWVLEAVGRQIREWLDGNQPIVPVAINISPVQLKDPKFMSVVRRILAINRLLPSLLEFEITESTFLDSNQCILDLLDSLRLLGIRIALDDFGAGYSSLTYIRTMALDRLKIDRSFIKDMNERQTDKAIIRTIISLAHILNLEIVAEGVENHDQFDYLKRIGCNVAQGYLFSKPIPADQVAALFAQ